MDPAVIDALSHLGPFAIVLIAWAEVRVVPHLKILRETRAYAQATAEKVGAVVPSEGSSL